MHEEKILKMLSVAHRKPGFIKTIEVLKIQEYRPKMGLVRPVHNRCLIAGG